MKRFCMFLVLLVVSAIPTVAQDSKLDIFGGYSYLRAAPGGGLPDVDASGWEGSVAYNWNHWLALKGDVDGHYCCNTPGTGRASVYNFLAGPQFNLGHGEFAPYLHGLVGGSHGSQGSFSDTVLAFALGGGLDIRLSHRIAFRLLQADYLGTRYASQTQSNFRLSTGLVFHFGSK